METLRVHRPRIVLHGDPGLGQAYIGAAVLHHLEGYHVQSLDLGTLMGDATRVSIRFNHLFSLPKKETEIPLK
jgi:ATPase family AAA domain-containing protein 2